MIASRSVPGRSTRQNGASLISALDERWENYRSQVRICRHEFSEEAVHDLRVATRRLLAVLDIARALDPHPRLQRTRRSLKDQLDDLNDLRDVQVMLVEVLETTEVFPELMPFEIYLQEREKRLLRLARKQINSLKLSEQEKRLEKILSSLKLQTAGQSFHDTLFQALDNVFLRAMQVLSQVDASQSGTIHRLRLIFKKFRYMAEIVQPLVPGYPESQLERMHQYQGMMGDIQDIETFLDTLVDFSERGASGFDLKPIRRFYEKRHRDLISAFMDERGELITFWRAASDQPYPWENNHDLVHHPTRHRSGGNRVRRRRQSTTAVRQGSQENASHRTGLEGTGDSTRPDSDQPLSALDPDRTNIGKDV